MAEQQVTWAEFKTFLDGNGGPDILHLAHAELSSIYLVWVDFRGMILSAQIQKPSDDATVFDTSYKPKSNTKEADRVRITTCKLGRRLNDRSITYTTSLPGSMDNTDWAGVDFGDATYYMRDVNGAATADPSLCCMTWMEFYPTYDYEISGGGISLPLSLSGSNDDLWEIHVVGAPDIPAIYGGSVSFVANNRIKWVKGDNIRIDASLNPADLNGAVSPYARKLRFILLHPPGAQSEFQINIKLYR